YAEYVGRKFKTLTSRVEALEQSQPAGEATINDEQVSASSTYSSEKIENEIQALAGAVTDNTTDIQSTQQAIADITTIEIDDSSISRDSVFSSQQVFNMIGDAQETNWHQTEW
ncbi:MAG: hypothetical protein SWL02_09995, partial [Pseudomonadota bacterium]|nr:hypothetical protein [Pseudomonadota bacterium]